MIQSKVSWMGLRTPLNLCDYMRPSLSLVKTCYRNEDDDVEGLLYDLYSTMSDSVCVIIMNIEDA